MHVTRGSVRQQQEEGKEQKCKAKNSGAASQRQPKIKETLWIWLSPAYCILVGIIVMQLEVLLILPQKKTNQFLLAVADRVSDD